MIALTGGNAVLAIAAIVAIGISSQILGLALQTRLMDLSPTAPSLGAALCHSALNLGNATGACLAGLVIAAGYGYLAPAWVGASLTAVGLLVVATAGRTSTPQCDRALGRVRKDCARTTTPRQVSPSSADGRGIRGSRGGGLGCGSF